MGQLTSRKCLATSIAMTPEEQPMPARLGERMSVRNLKWFTSMEASEGVGAKQLHATTRMSICASPHADQSHAEDVCCNSDADQHKAERP